MAGRTLPGGTAGCWIGTECKDLSALSLSRSKQGASKDDASGGRDRSECFAGQPGSRIVTGSTRGFATQQVQQNCVSAVCSAHIMHAQPAAGSSLRSKAGLHPRNSAGPAGHSSSGVNGPEWWCSWNDQHRDRWTRPADDDGTLFQLLLADSASAMRTAAVAAAAALCAAHKGGTAAKSNMLRSCALPAAHLVAAGPLACPPLLHAGSACRYRQTGRDRRRGLPCPRSRSAATLDRSAHGCLALSSAAVLHSNG